MFFFSFSLDKGEGVEFLWKKSICMAFRGTFYTFHTCAYYAFCLRDIEVQIGFQIC